MTDDARVSRLEEAANIARLLRELADKSLWHEGYPASWVHDHTESVLLNAARLLDTLPLVSALTAKVDEIIASLKDGDMSDCCYGGSCVSWEVEKRLEGMLK